MDRRTVIVSGPLALRMRRADAARAGEIGLEILTLPLIAARLAGGFVEPVGPERLQPAIRSALDEGGLADLGALAGLPGVGRAVARTLAAAWRADIRIADRAGDGARLADLALLERRIRAHLPRSVLTPPDLRDAASSRITHAKSLLGEVLLDGLLDVEPVWRPLIAAIAEQTSVTWRAPMAGEAGWFTGLLRPVEAPPNPAVLAADVCADPKAEVVEALRWVRCLLAEGRAQAHEIAICATTTESWDEHVLVLAREAGLSERISFSCEGHRPSRLRATIAMPNFSIDFAFRRRPCI